MKYSEQEMAALISEVEEQFADFLAKAEAPAEETLEKTEEEVVEAVEKAEEEVEEETAQITKSEGESLDYDDEDYVEMDKLYKSMSKAEKEAHYQSLKKSMFGEEEVKTEEAQQTQEVEKTEETTEEKEGEKLEKTETDSLKEENAELKKSLEQLTNAMANFLKKTPPKRKAITKIEYIKKSEAEEAEEKEDVAKLTKSEIKKRLSAKAREEELKKSDREAINNYYLNNDSIESIKHLL